MKVAIDTNSLLSLVRYYLPFDNKSILTTFIKDKIIQGELIIIDKVFDQCKYNSSGLVIKSLDFLGDKVFLKDAKTPYNTESMIAPSPAKFLRMIDSNFVNMVVKNQRKLTAVEYENQKNIFLNDADMKLIIFCLNAKNTDEVILVTEETEISNDNKLFKKIPAICKELNIKTMTLPQLIAYYDGINIHFALEGQ